MNVLYLKLSQPTTFHCPFRIKSVGIKTDAEDEKIAISEDKEQMTIVLGFLDEKVYNVNNWKVSDYKIPSYFHEYSPCQLNTTM